MPKRDSRDEETLPPRARGAPRKSLPLRLSPELHDELRRWADQEFRSLNAHIEFLLREAVMRRRGGRRD